MIKIINGNKLYLDESFFEKDIKVHISPNI